MARQKAPATAAELAAYIKEVGDVHAHRFSLGRGKAWKLAFKKTKKTCGTDQCFLMRVKNVKEGKP